VEFGEAVKPLCGLLDALETDVQVDNYPRVMYEVGRQKNVATQQQDEEAEQPGVRQHRSEAGGEGPSEGRGRRMAGQAGQARS